MSNALEAASLIMVPSGYEDGTLGSLKPTDGSGDFTFSRGSNLSATRINEQGYIEKGYENLVLQSNSFLTTWTNFLIDTPTSGQAGYDGTNNAWLIECINTSNFNGVRQSISTTGVTTLSVYAKAGTTNFLGFFSSAGFGGFELIGAGTTGQLFGNAIDSKIELISNGWYRCSIVLNGNVSAVFIGARSSINSFNANIGDSIYIQDAMINQGLVAYPYIETTTAPVAGGILEDMPRLDWASGAPSLLLEPSRTNLVPNSEYLNAISSKSNSLEMNTSDTKSPEGVYNASKFDFTSGTRYIGPSIGTINDVVVSVFAKAGTHNFVQFVSSGNALFTINFDLSNGSSNVVGTAPSELQYDAEDYGNGWYRIWFYYDNAGANSTIYCWIVNSLTSSRASSVSTSGDVYLYGYQVEQDATYPTSYIPTYGVSQTRLKDVCGGAGDASTFNDDEGVLYAEIATLANDGVRAITLSDGGNNNSIFISYNTNGRLDANLRSGGIYQAIFNYTGVANPSEINKIAFKYKQNDFALWVNGVEVGTDSSGITPIGLDKLKLSVPNAITDFFFGNINQVLYFPTALSDSECIALTTIT